jgi:hypothetical protein
MPALSELVALRVISDEEYCDVTPAKWNSEARARRPLISND